MKIPLLAIGTALLVSSCASRYSSSPPDAGVTPNPHALLKSMSTRLASAKNYRLTVSNTIPKEVAEVLQQQPKNDVEVVVSRPSKFDAKISQNGRVAREMIYDGNTFIVVDGINNFYSKAVQRGSLDTAVAQMTKVYGFRPPLAEFVLSDPYRDIKQHSSGITYLGKGSVRESGGVVQCHRIGIQGSQADSELWLGVADSLPRRLKATKSGSNGADLIVDIDFLTWDMNPQVDALVFRHQPASGATEIPMITVVEANQTRR
jgi:hypothetical protein